MGLSKEQAMTRALADQLEKLLATLAEGVGRLEVIDYAQRELLADQVSKRALAPLVDAMGDGLDKAGNAVRAALDRLEHVTKALGS